MLAKMFRRFQRPIMLGRWNMKNATRTVEQAMHDNCGCTKTVDVIQEPFDNTMEISLCALQSFHVYGTYHGVRQTNKTYKNVHSRE